MASFWEKAVSILTEIRIQVVVILLQLYFKWMYDTYRIKLHVVSYNVGQKKSYFAHLWTDGPQTNCSEMPNSHENLFILIFISFEGSRISRAPQGSGHGTNVAMNVSRGFFFLIRNLRINKNILLIYHFYDFGSFLTICSLSCSCTFILSCSDTSILF